jgi:Peptidase family M1 domain
MRGRRTGTSLPPPPLRYYGEWYGAYPYPQITIVDPAWQSGSGGMEYPTIFTAGSRWLAPRQSNEPEAVTVHEAGHQFWYGMVANNEVTSAWMDEGLNTFSDARVQDVAFQPDFLVQRFFGGFLPWRFRDIRLSRATDYNLLDGYRAAARRDAPITPSYQYWPGTHVYITYAKTALWLHTIERLIGWERLRFGLATYFQRFRFRHPTPDDFFNTINQEAGQDLTWFFEEAYATANVFDYAAERLESTPVSSRGFDDGEAGAAPVFRERTDESQFRTTVVVRRIGEGHFPIDVLVTFENGEQVRERWDGQARWQPYEYVKASKAVAVQVDPDRVLLLDVNYTNNSITLKPKAEAAADRWTLAWIVWLQDLLLDYAFFV